MFKSLAMLWTACSVFFLAFEKLSLIFLHLCTAGSEMAEDVLITQRRERAAEQRAADALELAQAQAAEVTDVTPVASPRPRTTRAQPAPDVVT